VIHENTAFEHLGIEFLEVGDDFIRARVPVDTRTRQPFGLLHGGVSVVLAEALGSCGAASTARPGRRARWGWTSTPTTCVASREAG
jgi:1,4-dihydroxy-2-naphthoyl-CoA hydrolase